MESINLKKWNVLDAWPTVILDQLTDRGQQKIRMGGQLGRDADPGKDANGQTGSGSTRHPQIIGVIANNDGFGR